MSLTVNGKAEQLDVEPDMPLLWAIRETLRLIGTKYACGIAQCGACTVHLDGSPVVRDPVSAAAGRRVTTIEGLSATGDHPVQKAWMDVDVPQCGFCQSGQIMSAVALLAAKPSPTDADIDAGMASNLDQVKAKMEGGAVYALTALYYGRITVDKGRVQQPNFHDDKMLRIDEMPLVEVHILDSGQKVGGLGEPGVPSVAPAVCNAIYALTGTPLRTLPIDPTQLKRT